MGLYEMFEEICDSYKFDSLEEKNKRYVTFEYDATNDNDIRIKKMIKEMLLREQPLCENCKFSERVDTIYLDCKKHGFLDWYKSVNPEHDGSLCEDYKENL